MRHFISFLILCFVQNCLEEEFSKFENPNYLDTEESEDRMEDLSDGTEVREDEEEESFPHLSQYSVASSQSISCSRSFEIPVLYRRYRL